MLVLPYYVVFSINYIPHTPVCHSFGGAEWEQANNERHIKNFITIRKHDKSVAVLSCEHMFSAESASVISPARLSFVQGY